MLRTVVGYLALLTLVLSAHGTAGCAAGGAVPIGPPPDPARPVVSFSEELVGRRGYALYLRNDTDSPVTVTEVRYTECVNVRGGCLPQRRPFVIEPGAHRRVDTVEPHDGQRAFRYRWTFRFSRGRFTGAQARGSSASAPVVVEETDSVVVLLDPRGAFVNMVIPGVRPDTSAAFARRVTRHLYRSFTDAFDFVAFSFPDGEAPGSPSGKAFRAKYDVRGIGLPTFDNTDAWGSDGRLMGALYLAQHRILDSPTSLHEIAHLWGQGLLDEPGDGHWGFAGGGMLGGWEPGTLEEAGGGTWVARGPGGAPGFLLTGPNREGIARRVKPYAPLELYLMGFLPADSVPPFRVAYGGEWVVEGSGIFRADSIRTLTMGDVVRRSGARDPRPRRGGTLRGVYVLVSPEPLEGGARDLVHADVVELARPGARTTRRYLNFWEATGGRGTLVMDGLFDTLREPHPAPRRRPARGSPSQDEDP